MLSKNNFFLKGTLIISCLMIIIQGCKKQQVFQQNIKIGFTSTLAGGLGYGFENGQGPSAFFTNLNGMTIDADGNLYVTDETNNVIRKVTPGGLVSTYAGSGKPGYIDGPDTTASFNNPFDLAIDAANNIYVCDIGNNVIRKISPSRVVTTWAGSGLPGFTDGVGTAASFSGPNGITVDYAGNVYVSDNNQLIRKITPAREVSTFAGSFSNTPFANGIGKAAIFSFNVGLASDAAGNIYVADFGNNMIRKITPTGLVSTLAGKLTAGSGNGAALSATFHGPIYLTTDVAGNIYVSDDLNRLIRKIAVDGKVTTVSGGGGISSGSDGYNTVAIFKDPRGIAVDAKGNIYVADQQNYSVRKITQ
jgi:sugar lactone lactonase YvrE